MAEVLKPIEGLRTVTPHIVAKGAAEAIEFYTKAFDAVEQLRHLTPDGLVMHSALKIGDSEVYLCDEFPNSCATSPKTLGGTPVTLHLYVDDADAVFNQAVEAGAEPVMPPADMFWGSRYGQVIDPFGHRWSVATPLAPEAAERARAAFAEMCAAAPQPV
jgi:PhnB protein